MILIYFSILGFGIGFLQARVVLSPEFSLGPLAGAVGSVLDDVRSELDSKIDGLEQKLGTLTTKTAQITRQLQARIDKIRK